MAMNSGNGRGRNWREGVETWDMDRGDVYRGRTIDRDVEREYGTGYGGSMYGYGSDHRFRAERQGFGRELGGHRGKGPRNYMPSDQRIREVVCEMLTDDDRIDASRIDVDVHDGEVTLSGSVEDRQTKRLAEDLVERLSGVRDVHNRIRVHAFDENIDHLNSFLRGELSAVQTYRMALDKLDRGSPARRDIEGCLRSHEERISFLRAEIRRLGGRPSESSGPWGVLARMVEGGARILGDRAAIAALEEGEDHGLKDYQDDLDKLDPECRELVQSRLLPAQRDTHARMSSLKHRMSS